MKKSEQIDLPFEESEMQKDYKFADPRVVKDHVDTLYKQLELVVGKISETRLMCSALLDGFNIADGFSDCTDLENFNEEKAYEQAQKDCCLKALDQLRKLEGYRFSRFLNEKSDYENNKK